MTDLQNLAFGLPDGIFEPANFFMYIAGFPEIDFIKTDPLPKVIDISLTKASGYGDPLEAIFMFLADFFMCFRIGHFSVGEFLFFCVVCRFQNIFNKKIDKPACTAPVNHGRGLQKSKVMQSFLGLPEN
jgi:hypothetical protein